MKQLRLFLCLLALAACLAVQPVALAADITVIADTGVADALAGEFQAVVATVARFYQEVYAATPAKPVKIIVVRDETGYQQALQREGYTSEQAAGIVKANAGLSLAAKPVIIICADKNTDYHTRIRTVTHQLFYQLRGEQRSSAAAHNWLAEGSAKLSESVILDWLGESPLADYRQNLINSLAVVRLKADPGVLAEGGSKWNDLVNRNMYPYEISELMTDYLISMAGKPPVVKYFAYLRETGSRDTAFKRAFGLSHATFIAKYKAHMVEEEAAVRQVKFVPEGNVSPEAVQKVINDVKTIERKLASQGWTSPTSLRFIIVPDQAAMLNVLRREQPQTAEARHIQTSQTNAYASLGGLNYVCDAGKAADTYKSFSELAFIMGQRAMVNTASPAVATAVPWLYDGGARLLAAKLADEAGLGLAEDTRRQWIATLKKAKAYPTLAELKVSTPAAVSRYGEETVTATASLAAAYLVSAPGILADYFTVLRGTNDGPRAFQQVFARTLDGCSAEFSAYLKNLLQ